MIRRAMAILGAALAAAGPVAAGDSHSTNVQAQLALAGAGLSGYGFRLDQTFNGSLWQGELGWANVHLVAGREYRIVGRCDGDCDDLDLFVERNGILFGSDIDPDAFPYVDIQPRRTGTYTVSARMVNCTTGPCRYGVSVFTR